MTRRKRGSGWQVERWFPLLVVCLVAAHVAAVTSPASVSPGAAVAGDTVPRHIRSSLSLYRGHPDVSDVRRELQKWDQEGGPTTAPDSVAVAGLWRRAGQYRSALDALPAERSRDGALRPRVALERARILLQAPQSGPGVPGTFEERRADGGTAFWRACEGMDGQTRTALWEDLRGLSTPDEQSEWTDLPSGPSACAWVRRFVGSLTSELFGWP
jgi:hypothetical protein